MALLRTLCWALTFILRLRFPPGSSLASIFYLYYKRNRKKLFSCVYGVIIRSGNVGRILEKRENTRLHLVFNTLLSYSPNIPRVHYHTTNARDSFSIS